MVESAGMCVQVSENWETKVETTRPIVPSVAQDFYGVFYDDIPVVTLNPEGYVQSIKLGEEVILVDAPDHIANAPQAEAVSNPNPTVKLQPV